MDAFKLFIYPSYLSPQTLHKCPSNHPLNVCDLNLTNPLTSFQ